jgi:hypothetical protein
MCWGSDGCDGGSTGFHGGSTLVRSRGSVLHRVRTGFGSPRGSSGVRLPTGFARLASPATVVVVNPSRDLDQEAPNLAIKLLRLFGRCGGTGGAPEAFVMDGLRLAVYDHVGHFGATPV